MPGVVSIGMLKAYKSTEMAKCGNLDIRSIRLSVRGNVFSSVLRTHCSSWPWPKAETSMH